MVGVPAKALPLLGCTPGTPGTPSISEDAEKKRTSAANGKNLTRPYKLGVTRVTEVTNSLPVSTAILAEPQVESVGFQGFQQEANGRQWRSDRLSTTLGKRRPPTTGRQALLYRVPKLVGGRVQRGQSGRGRLGEPGLSASARCAAAVQGIHRKVIRLRLFLATVFRRSCGPSEVITRRCGRVVALALLAMMKGHVRLEVATGTK
jgi:hypothetical protein